MGTKKIKIVCSRCNSEDITVDAWAKWDIEKQEWVLDTIFDDTYCDNCDGRCKTNEIELKES